MKDHVTVTLKSWRETRWESGIDSTEAVRYRAANTPEARLRVRDEGADALTETEVLWRRRWGCVASTFARR